MALTTRGIVACILALITLILSCAATGAPMLHLDAGIVRVDFGLWRICYTGLLNECIDTDPDDFCYGGFIYAGRAFAVMACLVAAAWLATGAVDACGAAPQAMRVVLVAVGVAVAFMQMMAFFMFLGVWHADCNDNGQSFADSSQARWDGMPIVFLFSAAVTVAGIITALCIDPPPPPPEEGAPGQPGQQQMVVVQQQQPNDGRVWVADFGLWWLPAQGYYQDPSNGWFFDARTQQWYQPQGGYWAAVPMNRPLPTGPPGMAAAPYGSAPPPVTAVVVQPTPPQDCAQ
eukprot:CAMPEP_0174832470 /NCGR_PEP_ID=MMETSP1114-20130205/3693_1 /TAXON_ID=312471 /ORGANISM="Neobodo designis, Strain CCAP 1951/1" /LENGTH=287 /DNA_ID=CAMNT_0016066329 /DNA_START=41 /DNA_END=904 /DNA_ORIENTATION=-